MNTCIANLPGYLHEPCMTRRPSADMNNNRQAAIPSQTRSRGYATANRARSIILVRVVSWEREATETKEMCASDRAKKTSRASGDVSLAKEVARVDPTSERPRAQPIALNITSTQTGSPQINAMSWETP